MKRSNLSHRAATAGAAPRLRGGSARDAWRWLGLFAFALLVGSLDASAATVVIVNDDAPSKGLNDPTPVAPVGGNTGTTLGQQRMIVMQRAADLWGETLQSQVPIHIRVSWPDDGTFGCESSPGAFTYLSQAGPTALYTGRGPFPAQPIIYPAALANTLVGQDLDSNTAEIVARFSPVFDSTPNCLSSYFGWWYGIDRNVPIPDATPKLPLLAFARHEFAHGLGFVSLDNLQTGAPAIAGYTWVWDVLLYDTAIGKFWDEMSNAQRVASAVNAPNLVWSGHNAAGAAPIYYRPPLRVAFAGHAAASPNAPATAAAQEILPAAYGEPLSRSGLSGRAVLVNDGSANPNQGCNPLTNGAAIAGKIAVVRRGSCVFGIKTRNAQAAGAIATLILNNREESGEDLLPIATADDFTIEIPSFTVAFAVGNALVDALAANPGMTVTIAPIPGAPDYGMHAGLPSMDAPADLQPLSSVSHWTRDKPAAVLMNASVSGWIFDRPDLTTDLLRDIGWPIAPGHGNTIFLDGFESPEIH